MRHSQQKQMPNDDAKTLAQLQADVGALEGIELLHALATHFGKRMAVQSSFGTDSGIVLKMIAQIDRDTPVLFMDTGMHFVDTLAYKKMLADELGLTNIRVIKPPKSALQQHDPNENLHLKNPSQCCALRKIDPMAAELAKGEFDIVVTGRSRVQSLTRDDLETLELAQDGILRANPLAHWGRAQRIEGKSGLSAHPLGPKFKSIGCRPEVCTRPVEEGEDERAGRWSGSTKTECNMNPDSKGRVGNGSTAHQSR